MIQPGSFDQQDRLHKIDKNGDPLAKINATVNWEMYPSALEKARDKGRQFTVGPKGVRWNGSYDAPLAADTFLSPFFRSTKWATAKAAVAPSPAAITICFPYL